MGRFDRDKDNDRGKPGRLLNTGEEMKTRKKGQC